MIELAFSIIILLWFLNRSSLLKGLKTHISMWSTASTNEAALDYAKDLGKKLKKASPEDLEMAKALLEGEELSLPSKKKKEQSKIEDMLDDIL